VIEPAIKNVVANGSAPARPAAPGVADKILPAPTVPVATAQPPAAGPGVPAAAPRVDIGKAPATPRLDVGKGPARPAQQPNPFAGVRAPGAAPAPVPVLDGGKYRATPPAPPVVASPPTGPQFRGIEAPVKDVLATTSTPAPSTDIVKTGVISSPQLVESGPGPAAGPTAGSGKSEGIKGSARPDTPASFVNPKVEPGKVRWHKSFDEARAASAKSGKPVLLFQMMGKLDDEFC
jgi:hypothetical protein